MYGDTATFVLHIFLLGVVLANVFLHTVVQDGSDAEGLILLDQRPDGHVVLTSHKLAIKCHLHELVEGSLAQDLLTQIHYLSRKGADIITSIFDRYNNVPIIYD